VLPAMIPDLLLADLDRAQSLYAKRFRPAKVGRGNNQSRVQEVRRDHIAWLDPLDDQLINWFSWTEALRQLLNQRLFLGLWDFECHFARYRRGDFYAKHLDAFRDTDIRRVSLVVYLNESWVVEAGGELVLYPQGVAPITVEPHRGTVVLFLSERIPHEVRPARRQRYSVAGWFRRNTNVGGAIDPSR